MEKIAKKKKMLETSSFCGATRNRTGDTRIFSPLLYQLSYGTIFLRFAGAKIELNFGLTKPFAIKMTIVHGFFSFFVGTFGGQGPVPVSP